MMSFSKFTMIILMIISAVIATAWFVTALLFCVAGINAVTQVSIQQFIILCCICISFCIAGDQFLTVTNLLLGKVRRND